MQGLTWGEFPAQHTIRGRNAGMNPPGFLFGLIAVIFTLFALAMFRGVDDFTNFIPFFLLLVLLATASAWASHLRLFGSDIKHLGLRVVNGGVDICFSYKVSFNEGDALQTHHVPWANVSSVVSIDIEDVYDHLELTFAPPLSYPRGTIETVYIDPGALLPKDKATAFAAQLKKAKSLALDSLSSNGTTGLV